MIEHLLTIDNIQFGIRLTKISRKADILDKYAKRTINGDLLREVIGTYYNYHLEFGYSDDVSRYKILWDKLTQPKAFHDIVIVDTIGKISFKGYIANVQDEIVYANPNDGMSRAFQSLSCDLVAKMPSIRAR